MKRRLKKRAETNWFMSKVRDLYNEGFSEEEMVEYFKHHYGLGLIEGKCDGGKLYNSTFGDWLEDAIYEWASEGALDCCEDANLSLSLKVDLDYVNEKDMVEVIFECSEDTIQVDSDVYSIFTDVYSDVEAYLYYLESVVLSTPVGDVKWDSENYSYDIESYIRLDERYELDDVKEVIQDVLEDYMDKMRDEIIEFWEAHYKEKNVDYSKIMDKYYEDLSEDLIYYIGKAWGYRIVDGECENKDCDEDDLEFVNKLINYFKDRDEYEAFAVSDSCSCSFDIMDSDITGLSFTESVFGSDYEIPVYSWDSVIDDVLNELELE